GTQHHLLVRHGAQRRPSSNRDGDCVMTLPSDNRAPKPRGVLSARRVALLATTIAGLGAAVFVAAPDFNLSASYPTAHAQNLTEQAHKLNAPVGFADIVAKVKPAVISVRVRIDGDK